MGCRFYRFYTVHRFHRFRVQLGEVLIRLGKVWRELERFWGTDRLRDMKRSRAASAPEN